MLSLALVAETETTPPLELALEAGEWLESVRIDTPFGTVWPTAPGEESGAESHLYSGAAGVVLFLVDLHAATKDERWLAAARRGGEFLEHVSQHDDAIGPGMYTGLGGVVFAMSAAANKDVPRGAKVAWTRNRLFQMANTVGAGVEWGDATDVISGSAGVGFLLLDWAQFRRGDDWRAAAIRTGDRLLELAVEEESGLAWPMTPTYSRRMPNYSHGTAGVAAFLAALGHASGKERFTAAAIKGGERLLSLEKDGLVCHHTGDGEDLFYLGWCHGPPGTTRLYRRLADLTGEARWTDAIDRAHAAVRATGVPEKRTEGFWENVGLCCGSAGLGMWALELGDEDLADRAYADIVARAVRVDGGAFWPQVEHRARPDHVRTQTGWMQGAAGVGRFCLALHAHRTGSPPPRRLPDELPR